MEKIEGLRRVKTNPKDVKIDGQYQCEIIYYLMLRVNLIYSVSVIKPYKKTTYFSEKKEFTFIFVTSV